MKPSNSTNFIAVLTGTWGTNNNTHSFKFNVRHIPEGLYKLAGEVNGGFTSDPTGDVTMGCKGKKGTPEIPVEDTVIQEPILIK